MEALIERRIWVFESLERAEQTLLGGLSAGIQVSNFQDTLFTTLLGKANLRLVDVGIGASSLIFLPSSVQGVLERNALFSTREILSFQISKTYLSSERHFGRLQAQYLIFFPDQSLKYLKLSVLTGILAHEGFPWSIRTSIGIFKPFPSGFHLIFVSGEMMKELKNFIEIGGSIFWTYRVESAKNSIGQFEHMLLSMGPIISMKKWGLKASAHFKVWIDHEVISEGAQTRSTYPIEIMPIPGFHLSWELTL